MTKIKTEMLNAIESYCGPVTKCQAGKARGADPPKKEDRTQQWLNGHRSDVPFQEANAERRRKRMARAERMRIANRNASVTVEGTQRLADRLRGLPELSTLDAGLPRSQSSLGGRPVRQQTGLPPTRRETFVVDSQISL